MLVTQSCLTLCDPLDCNPPGSSVHWDPPGKNTGVGDHSLLQGIFPTQGLNLHLLPCRQILHCLCHQGSPQRLVVRTKWANVCEVLGETGHIVLTFLPAKLDPLSKMTSRQGLGRAAPSPRCSPLSPHPAIGMALPLHLAWLFHSLPSQWPLPESESRGPA